MFMLFFSSRVKQGAHTVKMPFHILQPLLKSLKKIER